MSDEPIEQPAEPTERSVALPAFRRIWLLRSLERPQPVEDQQTEGEPDE